MLDKPQVTPTGRGAMARTSECKVRAFHREPATYTPGRGVVLVASYEHRLSPATARRLAAELLAAAELAEAAAESARDAA